MSVAARSGVRSPDGERQVRRRPRRIRLLAFAAAMLAVAACGTELSPARPVAPSDASRMYWSLALSHRAITLAMVPPYDTIRLTATPLDAHGEALTATSAATFTSSDLHTVQVDSTGLIRAIAPGSNILVIATLAEGNLIHVDTALVNVTSDTAPQPVVALSIHPAGTDSVVLRGGPFQFLGGRTSLPVVATNAMGDTLTDLALEVASSDTTIAKMCGVSSVQVDVCASMSNGSGRPGRVRIIASTTTYGVTVADTMQVSVTPPIFTWVLAQRQVQRPGGPALPMFSPGSITVAPGATVLFFNTPIFGFGGVGEPIDVVFDDSAAVAAPDTTAGALNCSFFGFPTTGGGSGNIAAFGDTTTTVQTADMCRARTFPQPGVYPYHSTLTGAAGTIVVTDGSDDP